MQRVPPDVSWNLANHVEKRTLDESPLATHIFVTNKAILAMVFREPTAADEVCQQFVANFGPFCDGSVQHIHSPENVWAMKFWPNTRIYVVSARRLNLVHR